MERERELKKLERERERRRNVCINGRGRAQTDSIFNPVYNISIIFFMRIEK